MVKIQCLAQFPVDHRSDPIVSCTAFVLVCCNRLLCHWPFYLCNLHLLHCCVLLIFPLIWLVLMALFCAARRDSVVPFRSYASAFLYLISPVCRLKYPYSYFSSHFCSLVFIVFLYVLMLPMLLLAVLISLSLFFLMHFLNIYIEASTQPLKLTSPLSTSFLKIYILSMSSLGWCKTLYIIINFLVLWSICLNSSLAHFKNGPDDLSRWTGQVFIPLMRFLR